MRSIPRKVLLLSCSLLLPACEQQMASQPSYRPLEPSTFFSDGRSARTPVKGTVAQGQELPDSPLVSSKRPSNQLLRAASAVAGGPADSWSTLALLAAPNDPNFEYVTRFPFELTEQDMKRGQERYTIFCAVCHDPLGAGFGKIVERGYTRPPNYHTDLSRGFERLGIKLHLRDAPVGYYFEVISKGFGAMPDYATQVPAADRWRIIAYIRALQLSQNGRLVEWPAEERRAAQQALEGNR